MSAFGFGPHAAARRRRGSVAAGPISFTGALPAAIIGQPYDALLAVSPPGSTIVLSSAAATAIAARGIIHDGYGRFTSASVS